MLCVLILYVSGGTYSLTSTSSKFLGNFFMAALFSPGDYARSLLRGNSPRNILFIFPLWIRLIQFLYSDLFAGVRVYSMERGPILKGATYGAYRLKPKIVFNLKNLLYYFRIV